MKWTKANKNLKLTKKTNKQKLQSPFISYESAEFKNTCGIMNVASWSKAQVTTINQKIMADTVVKAKSMPGD